MTRHPIRASALLTSLLVAALAAGCADMGSNSSNASPGTTPTGGPAGSTPPPGPAERPVPPPPPPPMAAPKPMAAASAPVSAADRRFVQEAGAGGAAEIALGRLAVDKATRDDVRQFGQKMVDDHTKAGDELKQVAGDQGLTPPDAPSPAQQRTADRIGKLSGPAFDRSFLNQMVLDHEKTVALFRNESRGSRNPELKAFATRTLPALQEHLTMVRMLQTKGGSMNRSSNAQSAPPAPSAPR